MNMTDIIDGDDDRNDVESALARLTSAFDNYEYRICAASEHIRIARQTVSDCIDACSSMLGDHGPTGQAFKNFANQLSEAEGDLSRAEGELLGADPCP